MRVTLALAMILIAGLSYSMVVPVNLDELTNKADRIVRARVVNLAYSPGTNAFGDELIFTDVGLHVSDALKGDRTNFLLRIEGGTIGDVTLAVSDSPEFKVGEDVLVFVKKDIATYRPLTGLTSKYTIARDGTIVENGMDYRKFKSDILGAMQRRTLK